MVLVLITVSRMLEAKRLEESLHARAWKPVWGSSSIDFHRASHRKALGYFGELANF